MIVRIYIGRAVARSAMAVLIALAVAGVTSPAVAQNTAPNAAPSPAAILLAKQVLQIKNVEDVFQPLIRGVVIKVRDMFMQTNFMWSKDLNDVAANLEKEYQPRSKELLDAAARIYATHFSEAELKQLLTFYQSPLGQKMIVEEPKALDESMAKAGIWADDLSQDVVNKMRAEMKKRGHDI
jgi:uncharacterized protein